MLTTETLAALAVGGFLGLAIPIAAIIVFKKKNRGSWLPSVFIGAATFVVFAMILESLLHKVMLPIVQGNTWAYAIYGALAAGVFEETGRFVAYKTLMKKHYTTKNSVLMGLGHGGVEAMIVLGVSYLAYVIVALNVNSVGGIEAYMETLKGTTTDELTESTRVLLVSLEQLKLVNIIAPVYERILAMTFHVCMSVWVYKAVTQKMWLYPAAIMAHAFLDFFAALFQAGVITSVLLLYGIFTVITIATVFVTVMLTKKYPDNAR